jgi:hypothetical protein
MNYNNLSESEKNYWRQLATQMLVEQGYHVEEIDVLAKILWVQSS